MWHALRLDLHRLIYLTPVEDVRYRLETGAVSGSIRDTELVSIWSHHCTTRTPVLLNNKITNKTMLCICVFTANSIVTKIVYI